MMVYLSAQRPAVHADGRRCTNMYETRNETVVQPGSQAAVPALFLLARPQAARLCQPIPMPAPDSVSLADPSTALGAAGRQLLAWVGDRAQPGWSAQSRRLRLIGIQPQLCALGSVRP